MSLDINSLSDSPPIPAIGSKRLIPNYVKMKVQSLTSIFKLMTAPEFNILIIHSI